MFQSVKGLVFDLDGTLFDSDKAYREALAAIGVCKTEYELSRRAVKERLGPDQVCARNRLLYFKEMADRAGRPRPHDLLALMADYERRLEEAIALQWSALGRYALLASLTAVRPAVILTNENLRTQLLKWRVIDPEANLFRTMITSEEVGVEKPHVAMFSRACDALELAPHDCLVIGDAVDCDILPALEFGCRAVWTSEFASKDCAGPPPNVPRVGRLDDLRGILR